jgi:hypothetical protein
MNALPAREGGHEREPIPALSQSRHGDMGLRNPLHLQTDPVCKVGEIRACDPRRKTRQILCLLRTETLQTTDVSVVGPLTWRIPSGE